MSDGTFYKRYSENGANVGGVFTGKGAYEEVAKKYVLLSHLSSIKDDPYATTYMGISLYTAADNYLKAGEKSKATNCAISAARKFLLSTNFHHENAPHLKDLWEDDLSNAIAAYNFAIQILIDDKKPNLAIKLIEELGKTEMKYGYYFYAGKTFERSVSLCVESNLPPSVLFSSLFMAIDCYTQSKSIDAALRLVDTVQRKYSGSTVAVINKSEILKKKLHDLRICRAQLLLMGYKKKECVQFTIANLDSDLAIFFEELCDSTMTNQIEITDALVSSAASNPEFNDLHLKIFRRHYEYLASSLETKMTVVEKR